MKFDNCFCKLVHFQCYHWRQDIQVDSKSIRNIISLWRVVGDAPMNYFFILTCLRSSLLRLKSFKVPQYMTCLILIRITMIHRSTIYHGCIKWNRYSIFERKLYSESSQTERFRFMISYPYLMSMKTRKI